MIFKQYVLQSFLLESLSELKVLDSRDELLISSKLAHETSFEDQ